MWRACAAICRRRAVAARIARGIIALDNTEMRESDSASVMRVETDAEIVLFDLA